MIRITRRQQLRGFTLVEALIATAVIGIAFAALGIATVALQKSLFSARDYSNALNAQTRIADYIRRDLRNALDAGVEAGGISLWIDLPDDYDTQGNPVDPTVGEKQTVVYTTPGARVRMRYYQDGSNFVREGGGTKTVVAPRANEFQPSFTELIKDGKLTAVHFAVTYAGKFGTGAANDPNGRRATELSTVLSLRNKPAVPVATPAPTPVVPRAKRKGR